MNLLKGFITDIQTADDISLVKVNVNEKIFSSIVIDTPRSNSWLQKGNAVKLLFKETEVMIARPAPFAISIQNKIECTVRRVIKGIILCELELAINGNEGSVIRSIITRNGCEQLQLQEQDAVIALIKTNEVSLSAHD